jgi:RNA polymerase sigma factor (sigma-70 family)
VQRSYAQQQLDFETLYRLYWKRVVRFCATRLTACPDGLAEEVAQDVFLIAHRALAEQRYRGNGALSTWLFGIARNQCSKICRETYRRMTPLVLRHLEREIARPGYNAAESIYAAVALAGNGHELVRKHLQEHVREAVHCDPPVPPDAPNRAEEALTVMRDSMQHLVWHDRQAYILLHMHVCKGMTVRELAGLQGMSRSAVARSLVRAKATLRTVYQAALVAQHYGAPAAANGSTGVSAVPVQKGRQAAPQQQAVARPSKRAHSATLLGRRTVAAYLPGAVE